MVWFLVSEDIKKPDINFTAYEIVVKQHCQRIFFEKDNLLKKFEHKIGGKLVSETSYRIQKRLDKRIGMKFEGAPQFFWRIENSTTVIEIYLKKNKPGPNDFWLGRLK